MLRVFGDEGVIDIRKTIKVYKIKEYYNNYNHRNELYYHILSKYVQCENPLKYHKKNQDLGNFHEDLKESRKEIG